VEHDGGFVVLGHALEHIVLATDAEYQNRIILHYNNLNLPVVHPDPNYPGDSHTAARRVPGT